MKVEFLGIKKYQSVIMFEVIVTDSIIKCTITTRLDLYSKELYESMAIYSANGSTIALAELIAGSETNFVKMMNDKGKELGLENYKFVNSTGLNNKDLQGNHPEGTGEQMKI